MSPTLLLIGRVAFAVGCFGILTSGVSFLLALIGGLRFRSKPNDQGSYAPPVSILKPLHGKEMGLEENLESLFTLNHPEFELIFCARSLTDPGILCAQEVARRFPSIPARFFASGEPLWQNPKTFSMSLLVEAAKHEVILFSDSDVRVSPTYLHDILQPLADPHVGLVTCTFLNCFERVALASPNLSPSKTLNIALPPFLRNPPIRAAAARVMSICL